MAHDNNKGLFDKIKKTVSSTKDYDFVGQNTSNESKSAWFEQNLESAAVQEELKSALEQEFKQRFAQEKQQLAQQFEAKLAQTSQQRISEQEDKFKQLFAVERDKYQKYIKQKYEQVAKKLLKQHEQALINKHTTELMQVQNKSAAQLAAVQQKYATEKSQQQMQIADLEQDLQQQKNLAKVQIEEAKIAARKDQEQLSRALFDDLLRANKIEIMKQAEENYQQQLLHNESRLKLEHNENISKLKVKLLSEYEQQLSAALSAQEQKLRQEFATEFAQQDDKFQQQLEKEVAQAVLDVSKKLQAEFAKEREQLNDLIESMRPEIEANKQRLRAQIEDELRVEFEWKWNQYKEEVEQHKNTQVQELLTVEKQKLAEELQQENQVVLKYKEREIRDICEAEKIQVKQQLETQQELALNSLKDQYTQDLQTALSQQEQRFAELEQKLQQAASDRLAHETAQLAATLNAKHAERLNEAVITERAKLLQQSTTEKKILLQQQQQALELKHAQELAAKLNEQALSLAAVNQDASQNLEAIIQQRLLAQNTTDVAQALALREQELRAEFAADSARLLEQQAINMRAEFAEQLASQQVLAVDSNQPQNSLAKDLDDEFKYTDLAIKVAQEKATALEIQRLELTDKFELTLRAAQEDWQKQQHAAIEKATAEALVKCEHDLRVEFQAILDQQRKQAEAHYSKQKEYNVRSIIAKIKPKLLQELRAAQTEELETIEDQLKEQYANKLQQQLQAMRADFAQAKQDLLNEQDQRVAAALERQKEELREEYRLKFAQLHHEHEQQTAALLEQERKKVNLKFAQDKANLIQEITNKYMQEKQIALSKYETELRDSLYKEMVKQKEYIQHKFTASQEAALQEQKRRLDAQHKQEIERIKQGFFDPKNSQDLSSAIINARPRHNQVVVNRGVEQLADQILSKFNR